MSTIKHSNKSHSHAKTDHSSKSSAHKAPPPKAEKPKETAAHKETPKDGFKASNELNDAKGAKDAKAVDKPGEAQTDPNKADAGKTDPSKTDASKTDPNNTDPTKTDPNDKDSKPGETDPTKEDAAAKEKQDAIDQQMAKLEEELRQLTEDKNKKPEAPEDLGGCCGKSHGSKKSGDEQPKDPNAELDQLATQVLAAQEGGKDSKNLATLKGTLEAKYEEDKQKGVEIKPEVEAKVQKALRGGSGSTKTPKKPDDKKQATGASKTASSSSSTKKS